MDAMIPEAETKSENNLFCQASSRALSKAVWQVTLPRHRPIYPTHKSMSPQLAAKRAFLACSAQAAFSNLPFFCPNNSCDAEVPKEIFLHLWTTLCWTWPLGTRNACGSAKPADKRENPLH